MKARLQGHVVSMQRTTHCITVECEVKGTAFDVKNPDAKTVNGTMKINMKPIVADDLKFGQVLYITVSTEDELRLLLS